MVNEVQVLRIGTGASGLDMVLKGGFLQGSVILICGSPGAGKTVLALQILFANIKENSKVIYFNALAEAPQKLILYHQGFKFFDPGKLNQSLLLRDVSQIVRQGDLNTLLNNIVREIQETEAHLVAIDHFRDVSEMAHDKVALRLFLSEFAQQVAILNCTGLILTDCGGKDALDTPEASLSDGVIQLGLNNSEDVAYRSLDVFKMRGTDFVLGSHPFSITDKGIALWTGAEPPQHSEKHPRNFLFK